ncbi:Aste57867_19863 [Aphanomyces stellatus]|uniref:Aste57867_19863 protein n=1 Tax=Aphanomyces stellatus TaxID=120398 RepID=A0A485LDR5_9STRA|nr:hypothetical protein As57867_019797 [Aphanomyces stellatus]VFT96561.1 Aste57867_19863 [Aphanomyces stellatus]
MTRTTMQVLYITDVEGNWDYFDAFVAVAGREDGPHGGALSFTDDSKTQLTLRDGYIFVFGGDVGDKGVGTLRIIMLLVDLKQRYPGRVVLIAGNRDINKMRWTSEFTDIEMCLSTMDPGIKDGPHWLPMNSRQRLGLLPYLCKDILGLSTLLDECSPEVDAANTRVHRMLWMLKCTMGSDGDFERRRTELGLLHHTAVDDDAVLASFLDSVGDGGIMREYLTLCVLGFIHGTTLFIHGGVVGVDGGGADGQRTLKSCLGLVPPADSRTEPYARWVDAVNAGSVARTDDIAQWIDELNAWYLAQIHEWIAHPTWDATHSFRGGENIQHYVHTGAPYSVVSGRHLEKSGMPCRMTRAMTEHLWHQGIHRMIIGHTPHGNAPTVVKHALAPDNVFEVIMCDTSYSDVKAKDMRGTCVSMLLVDDDERVWVEGHICCDSDDVAIDVDYGFATVDDPYVGHDLLTGEFVKTRLNDAQYLLCTVANEYTYTYKVVDRSVVAATVAVQPLV